MRVTAGVGAFALVLGLIVDASGAWEWMRNRSSPAVGLATYELVEGVPTLTGGQLGVLVDPEDVYGDRIRLGLPLAVTNLEDDDLDVVRVEISYPASLKVRSAGRGKIDPTGRTIVYEHELGSLRATGDFTPLAPLDEIVVPFDFTVVPSVALTNDGVPFYWLTVIGAGRPPFSEVVIEMTATLYFEERSPVSAELHWAIEPGVEVVSQGSDDLEERSVTRKDRALFVIPSQKPSRYWTDELGQNGSKVSYRQFRTAGTETQVVAVDGIVRRVIIDDDRDGYIDLDLMDTTGDGEPDLAGGYPAGRLFVDWWPNEG